MTPGTRPCLMNPPGTAFNSAPLPLSSGTQWPPGPGRAPWTPRGRHLITTRNCSGAFWYMEKKRKKNFPLWSGQVGVYIYHYVLQKHNMSSVARGPFGIVEIKVDCYMFELTGRGNLAYICAITRSTVWMARAGTFIWWKRIGCLRLFLLRVLLNSTTSYMQGAHSHWN